MQDLQEITRCVNQRPIYEAENGDLREWSNPMQVSGELSENYSPTYHPFVIDIETSAQLGQRPILLVGYNTLEDRLIVLYSHGYCGYTMTENKVRKLCDSFSPKKVTLHNLSQSNFEKFILRPIAEWNEKAKSRGDDNRISLVAHNAEFDIPMMGTPDDELLDSDKIGNQYEQSVQYKHINMIGHRAGQFGHIFSFLDSGNNFEHLHIPVGDTMVGAKALWIPAKLKDACESIGVDLDVSESEEHGVLNDEYVQYCINDVYATTKLYYSLQDRINKMFGDLPLEHIYSTASIGKFVLREMGYTRPGYEQEAIDRIAPAYFGGRTDAEITGEIVENQRYTDILSEYPTVSKLTNVWEYTKAKSIGIKQIPVSDLPDIPDMTNPDNWAKISDYYVKVKPEGATLPIRTPHLEDTTKVITSQVHCDTAMHYHFMDIVSANLIDNKQKYEIVAAWEVTKHGTQDLQATEIGDIPIKPEDNVMAKCIESRKEVQKENKEKGLGNKSGKDERTKSLKITANSMYGITAERIVKEVKEFEMEKHDFASQNGYYNPHVATTITAGGRLMIALGESVANANDGVFSYCDTDSLIVSDNCAEAVIGAFADLNPYDGYAGTLDVLEDEKGQVGNLYTVGTKKYIFFSNDGEVLEAKEHGLGNYDNLRDEETIHRLWATIMYYDLQHNPLNVDVLYDNKMNENVLWSFNASTRSMRTMINEFTDDYLRYGDWVQSTLAYNNEVRYMALNLMEKQQKDTVAKAYMDGEDITKVEEVEFSEMMGDSDLKTVKDVVHKFVADSAGVDERPSVKVTNTRYVTKEATSRKDIFVSKLQEKFRQNMSKAIRTLFT